MWKKIIEYLIKKPFNLIGTEKKNQYKIFFISCLIFYCGYWYVETDDNHNLTSY